jgi:enoyl-[acyl-carrier protein] reductase I
MGFLAGKRLLITGVLNNRSIAYGIARACHREGAELAFSYQGERFKERITEFAAEFGSTLTFDCDVGDDAQIEAALHRPGRGLAGVRRLRALHRFAPREAIAGDFLDGLTRENFRIAHDISAYSFPAMAKAAAHGCARARSLLTLSYLGAVRYVPNYNTMGLAKAARIQRALPGASLGARGIRVNGMSAGPIKTLAASGIKDFGKLLTALRRDGADPPQRHDRGRRQRGRLPAVDLAAGISAEITYVDGGFSQGFMAGCKSERYISVVSRATSPRA